MHKLLDDFPVTVDIPVAWAEMDFFRHVNNTVYFRWFETARIAYLERIGFASQLLEQGLGPILASTSARFRRPVFYPDTVTVGVRTSAVTEDRFTNVYRAISERQGEVVAEGEAVVVAYDYGARTKTAIPDQVRRAIAELDG